MAPMKPITRFEPPNTSGSTFERFNCKQPIKYNHLNFTSNSISVYLRYYTRFLQSHHV